MKNIIQILSLLLCLLIKNVANAQLPLKYGDVVVTFKHDMYSASLQNQNVVSVIKTRNTSSATPGQVWTSAQVYSNPNWNLTNLGSVFGITIDKSGSIYLSSTEIYGPNATKDKIFKIDGATEAISTIASNAINAVFKGPYGNIKHASIGGNELLYVSDWGNGLIHRLKKNSSGNWVYQNSFNPEFNRPVPNLMPNTYADGQVPYGLAIRKTASENRLYYSRIGNTYSRNGNIGLSNGFMNEIWYIILDNNGNFITTGAPSPSTPNGEFYQTIPYHPGASNSSGSGAGLGITGLRFNNPIADIAFTSDAKKMLLGQQPLKTLSDIGSHSSEVIECIESSPNVWIKSGNLFPTGQVYTSGTPIYQTNAVGGISYSNNILYKDSLYKGCDTTVWAVSDLISINSSYTTIPIIPSTCSNVYGLMGYTNTGILPYSTSITNYQSAILIDEDLDYSATDKYRLGDVEAYKDTLMCSTCSCGKFTKASFNGTDIPNFNFPTPFGTSNSPDNYLLSLVKGNTGGVFHVEYDCEGTCDATTKWELRGPNDDNRLAASGNDDGDISLDFQRLPKMECGLYSLVITPTCAGKECDPLRLLITIVCEPPSCCDAKIEIKQPEISVRSSTNPDITSVLNGQLQITADKPMSDVRINIEEFRLSANSQNCLLCKNRPNTWGSILNTSLNGIPGTLDGGYPIGLGERATAIREAVFKNGQQPITLAPGLLNFSLGLPAITDLSCCEVNVYLCLKITFKDVNCKECVRMICDTYTLTKPSPNGVQKKSVQKPVIFTPIN